MGCLSANLLLSLCPFAILRFCNNSNVKAGAGTPETTVSLGVQSWGMTCAVCAWTVLTDSDMSPVYTRNVCASDVLPAGEGPSQGLGEAGQVSKGHPTHSRGWAVLWNCSEQ